MRRITGVLVIGLALVSQSSRVSALGFGSISNSTVLGQQLEFSVVVTTDGGESLSSDCIKADVFAGENMLSSSVVRTRLDTPVDGGPSILRVVTNVRIDEPVAAINVAVGCPPRLVRKFVVFVDPPVIASLPSLVVAASADPAAPGGDAQTSGVADANVATAPLAPGRTAGTAPEQPLPTVKAKPRPRSAADRVPRVAEGRSLRLGSAEPRRVGQVQRRSAVAGGTLAGAAQAAPRLKLEAELPAYRPSPSAPSTATASPAAASGADAASSVDSALASAEQLRIRLLEQNIDKLLSEARATQSSLAAMQSRLREAESSRFASPLLIYALLGLIGLLLALLAWLLWRQSQLKREQAWWLAGADGEAAAAAAEPVVAAPSFGEPQAPAPDAPVVAAADPAAVQALPQIQQLRNLSGTVPQTFVVDGGPGPASRDLTASVSDAPARDMSVEELIDMEQQAEFFIVLGQDDAAIDLLMGHVRNGGATSPLAFLKLLEIYRRRGEREPYERVRERFNRRFNAYAPDWESGSAQGRALESYPEVTAKLEATWPEPAQAMALLAELLFRRDENAGTFDLPAYGELLFLYSQARDLAENTVPSGDVDLLLPLGEDADFDLPNPTAPTPFDAAPSAPRQPPTIDFDLDLDLPVKPRK